MNSSELDIHRADAGELRQCFANVFDTWPMAETLEDHVERRLASPQHRAATWYVGTLNGQVATSCGVYPAQFECCGQRIAGFMIGAVHTPPGFRRRGFAAQLIRELELDQQQNGAELSILYSDIAADYYARLGYQLCPSHEILWSATTGSSIGSGRADAAGWRESKDHWSRQSEMLHLLYERATAELPFRVARPPDYWRQLAHRFPNARLLWYEPDSFSEPSGYALWRPAPRPLILEVIIDPCHSTKFQAAWSMLAESLVRTDQPEAERSADIKNPEAIRGWYPRQTPPALFQLQARTVEQTMLKPLSTRIHLTQDIIEAAGRLQYLDHV